MRLDKNTANTQQSAAFAQSALHLTLEYGKSLDRYLAAEDPFYSLHELFSFSGYSICQLLNLIEAKMEKETGYTMLKSDEHSLSNLLYHDDILQRTGSILIENIRIIEQRGSPAWPRAADKDREEKAVNARMSLQKDFEELLRRTEVLSIRCKQGMNVKMSNASIAESERAIHQASRVEQLTRLAFFYIPISFTTSFFGMNLGAVGQGKLQLWVWVAVSVPVVLMSYVMLGLFSRRIQRKQTK